jgi:hypothetical protein
VAGDRSRSLAGSTGFASLVIVITFTDANPLDFFHIRLLAENGKPLSA